MDFLAIGSVNQYAKARARRMQWTLKKQNGDLTSHKKSLRDDLASGGISSLLPEKDPEEEKMSAILTKVQAGKKLSHSEWEYIREKNPTLYEKLKEVEKEARNHEEALRRCKTKDEARRLHMSKLGEILESAKRDGESALYRLNRMTETMTDFTKSRNYHELPTEAEEAVERESERKAKVEALQEEAAAKEAQQEAEREARAEESEGEEATAQEGKAEKIPAEEGSKVKEIPAEEGKAKKSLTHAYFPDTVGRTPLFPAHAGVIRTGGQKTFSQQPFPRTRGGDPQQSEDALRRRRRIDVQA